MSSDKPILLSSLDHPFVQPYRTLRRSEEHIREGIFVAEGEKVVRRLLRSPLEVVSFLLTSEWLERLRSEEIRFSGCAAPVFTASTDILNNIVGYRLHQGIMAVGKVPPDRTLADLLSPRPEPALFVALDGLMNSENVGVIVRNCAGFGVDAILVGETSSSPYLRRAVRNSMGTVFQVPVFHSANLAADLRTAKKSGMTVFGADPAGAIHLTRANLTQSSCLVLGNEESGISASVREVCDLRLAIPMRKQTDSLNVSSASAVFLHEVRRQRDAE